MWGSPCSISTPQFLPVLPWGLLCWVISSEQPPVDEENVNLARIFRMLHHVVLDGWLWHVLPWNHMWGPVGEWQSSETAVDSRSQNWTVFFFFYSEVERRQLAGKVSVKDVRRQRDGPKKMSDGSLGKVMRRWVGHVRGEHNVAQEGPTVWSEEVTPCPPAPTSPLLAFLLALLHI